MFGTPFKYADLPITGAVFQGGDRGTRLALWRIWRRPDPPLLFVGLNPSTATEYQDDPTIRRVARFAQDWGFGGLFVGNLFAQVTPYPTALDIGRDQAPNNESLREMKSVVGACLVGWGHFGDLARTRVEEVLEILGTPVFCLGKTKDGWPKHPLYLRADTQKEIYERGTK